MTSTSTQANPHPDFSISSSGPESSSITHKKAEISAMADYCDPDLMLITETKLDSNHFSSELLPKGYGDELRKDRNLNG